MVGKWLVMPQNSARLSRNTMPNQIRSPLLYSMCSWRKLNMSPFRKEGWSPKFNRLPIPTCLTQYHPIRGWRSTEMKPIYMEKENQPIIIIMLVRIQISMSLTIGCRSLSNLNNNRASKINRSLANLINNLSCNHHQLHQSRTGGLSLRAKERRWGRSMQRPSEKNWQGSGMITSKIRRSFYRVSSSCKRKIRKVVPYLTQAKWWRRGRSAITAGRRSSGHCTCSTRRLSSRTSL